MGYGWTHSLNLFLRKISDYQSLLGGRKAREAALLVSSYLVGIDLMRDNKSPLNWVSLMLLHEGLVGQTVKNAVAVHLGPKIYKFVRLPDGTYEPPPGVAMQLIANADGTHRLEERFGPYYNFDAAGRIVRISDADGNEVHFTYTDGKLSQVEDAFGRTFTLTYTGDLLTRVQDSTGRGIGFGYDSDTNLTSFTDFEEGPYGNKTIYHFDTKGRTTQLERELGVKVKNTYDAENHKIAVENPRGHITRFTYDGQQNLTAIENALNRVTSLIYDDELQFDPVGNLLRLTDKASAETSFEFDLRDLVKIKNDPLEQETHYTYDDVGRLISRTDRNGHTVMYSYTASGELERITYPDGANLEFT